MTVVLTRREETHKKEALRGLRQQVEVRLPQGPGVPVAAGSWRRWGRDPLLEALWEHGLPHTLVLDFWPSAL